MQTNVITASRTSSYANRPQAKNRNTLAALFVGIMLTFAGGEDARASDQPINFYDPDDGKLDMSDYLLNHKGALVVPSIITEPAVGYGLGVGLAFFSQSISEAAADAKSSGQKMAPPNITVLGGAKTENGTWGAGLAHFHTWDGDRYRYLGAIAKVDAQLDYYGQLNRPRGYELEGVFLMQQLLARVGDSNWYVGPRYVYFDANTRFTGEIANEIKPQGNDLTVGKLGLVVDYDSRDNIFYPGSGTYAEFEAQFARSAFGGMQNFDQYNARGYTWLPIAKNWILGLRADGRFSSGDIPFYAQPYIDLRGVSKARYQDQNAVATEMELRWDVTPRWSILGFTGVGKAYGKWNDFSDASTVTSVGTGFRYLIARKLGLSLGIDVARSKDESAFYIQVGSAWR